MSNLTTPASVQKLQTALHDKAKGSPDFRFHALYDKVYRKDVLAFAYECCKANGGAAGVDSQTFEDIAAYGVERWLDELVQELKRRTYQPLPVRRVYIPKPDGKQRPLGVPAIRDRVAETAAVLVLEPIFEADLPLEQYAYRQDRSALDAVQHVHKLINHGHGEVVDADLSSYFDTLPHAELLKSVARRVVDGAMLHLIKMWLEAPVEETDERGKKHRSMRNRDEGRGSPQGSPISPLLSNLYMRRFVLGWKRLGYEKRWKAYIVNYADDLVICCRYQAEEALGAMRDMMTKLKLTVNEKKTRVCRLPEEKFDFLGYSFGRCYSPKTGRAYIGTTPSKKRVQRICQAISAATRRSQTQQAAEQLVEQLNRQIIGWANYFCLGPVSKAYRDERGKKHRSMRNRDEGRGSPQGSPISPLLSNLYMRRFVLGWKRLGYEKRWKAYIVNYADDLVICCRYQAEEALGAMRDMMTKLKLTVNEKKTRVCRLPEEKFDFLGYSFGRCYSPKTGRAYIGTTPSKKRVQRICQAISAATRRSQTQQAAEQLVEQLNRQIIGWANYFCLGPVSKAYRAVEEHTRRRLRQWLCTKHQRKGAGTTGYSDQLLHNRFGLVRLAERTASFPWATP